MRAHRLSYTGAVNALDTGNAEWHSYLDSIQLLGAVNNYMESDQAKRSEAEQEQA